MDVDDLLRSTALPETPVDSETALAATVRRGRARRRRRSALLGTGALLALAGLAAAISSLINGDGGQQVVTGRAGSAEAPTTPPTGTPPTEAEPGDPAVWSIDPDMAPSPDASTFIAEVSRLGCNGGITGTVLRPAVELTRTEIVVTFTVEDRGSGPASCPGNDLVPYEVDLREPIGDRALVDGACSPGAEAATTIHCTQEGSVRWRPAGPVGD